MSDEGRTITPEVKVGAVISALLVLLVAFLVAYGKFARAVKATSEVRVVFSAVSNLRSEARVYYNGLHVGRVGRIQLMEVNDQTLAPLPPFTLKDLDHLPFTTEERASLKEIPTASVDSEIRKRLQGKSMVELLLDITREEDKKRFHDDDVVRLGSTLMGESSVQIFAGTGTTLDSTKPKLYLGQGGDMYSSLANALEQVKNVLATAAELMGGGDQSPMARKIAGLDEFTANLENRVTKLDGSTTELMSTVDNRLEEAREAFGSMDNAIQNLKPELTKTLDKAQTQLQTMRDNVGKVTANGKKTITDVRANLLGDLVEIGKQMKERRGTWPTMIKDSRDWTDAMKTKVTGLNDQLEGMSRSMKGSSADMKASLIGYAEQIETIEEKTWYFAHYPSMAFNPPTEEEDKEMKYERKKDVLTKRYKEMRPKFDRAFSAGPIDPAKKAQIMAIVAEMDAYLLSAPVAPVKK